MSKWKDPFAVDFGLIRRHEKAVLEYRVLILRLCQDGSPLLSHLHQKLLPGFDLV